ncbi:glycosyltransferase family A protein [Acuticoccus sediminis]|uniref:glycosyltransferase family A protein n=1 Tax=Acuticoccus sediminis TaxID=2184697 RepID=UPI001CFE85B0|nr:glycosyltransferase family A protein [Acuticoccus sediminis]
MDHSYPATTARPAVHPGPRGVSVVIPFRRFDGGLEEAVASVWAQRGVTAEVVLVAAGAPDRDTLRAERLAAKGPCRMAYQAAPARGAALARGIATAGAAIVTTLDSETVLTPHKLAADAGIVAADPRAVAVCDLERTGPGRGDGGAVRWSFDALEAVRGGALTAHVASRARSLPRHMTLSRALYGRTTGFDTALGAFADWALAIELTGLASGWVRTPRVGLNWTPRPDRRPVETALWDASLDLHLAFLRNGDMLATRFGADALTFLKCAAETVVVSTQMRMAWAHMDDRATFPGHVLTDLRALRAALAAAPGTPRARLEAAYAALTVPA